MSILKDVITGVESTLQTVSTMK